MQHLGFVGYTFAAAEYPGWQFHLSRPIYPAVRSSIVEIYWIDWLIMRHPFQLLLKGSPWNFDSKSMSNESFVWCWLNAIPNPRLAYTACSPQAVLRTGSSQSQLQFYYGESILRSRGKHWILPCQRFGCPKIHRTNSLINTMIMYIVTTGLFPRSRFTSVLLNFECLTLLLVDTASLP